MTPHSTNNTSTNNALAIRGGQLTAPQLDYILLDGSASMQDQWWQSLSSIDAYVEVLAGANLNAQVILATFDDTDRDCLQRDCNLADWRPLSKSPIGAHYTDTPLYDAINLMGRRIRDLNPQKAHIVIVTDGDENASKWTDQTQAKAILNWCRAKGYQVTFIGASFDNAKQAALLGSTPSAAIGVRKELLTEATRGLAQKRISYGLAGTDIHFSNEERTKFGGYLTTQGDHK